MIEWVTNDNPLFQTDNAMVYSMLEVATRGAVYASTVKPYGRKKDGRTVWQSMIPSNVGTDKWEILQNERMNFMSPKKWNGRKYFLEKFTGMYRISYVQLEEAQEHVNFQLPTKHTQVGYLIDNIENNDPDLRAAIANVKLDTTNIIDDFEAAVECLLPIDLYVKHKKSNIRNPQISDLNGLKGKSQSKTGVDVQ